MDQKPKPKIKKRKRSCKICRTRFDYTYDNVWWCSDDCAVELATQRLKKRKEQGWKERKDKLRKDLGIEKKGNADNLQRKVNEIALLLDDGLPCIVFPLHKGYGQAKDPGHLISRKANSAIKYLLLNVHGESKFSNSDQSIPNSQKVEGLRLRYNQDAVDALNWIIRENAFIKLYAKEKEEKILIAREIITELKAGVKMTRREVDERLSIYKLPPKEMYYI